MQLRQCTPHIYYTECDPSKDRPVLGYIQGEAYSIMIDAGNSAAHVHDYLCALKDKPQPKQCILTHWHWDHSFGIHALPCPSIAHINAKKELERMSKWEWSEEAMRQRLLTHEEIEFADEHIRNEYEDVSTIQVVHAANYIREDQHIDCGNLTCHCLHAPSAHSDDTLLVYIPQEKIIFIGDSYNDDFYNRHSRDLDKTKGLYELLNSLDFEWAIPGHGASLEKAQLLAFLHRFF